MSGVSCGTESPIDLQNETTTVFLRSPVDRTGRYLHGLRCEWEFQSSEGLNIYFKLLEGSPFELEEDFDVLGIFTSPDAKKPEHQCEGGKCDDFLSRTSYAKIVFFTDATENRRGFQAKVRATGACVHPFPCVADGKAFYHTSPCKDSACAFETAQTSNPPKRTTKDGLACRNWIDYGHAHWLLPETGINYWGGGIPHWPNYH